MKIAFFHGELEKDIYMSQLKGLIVQGQESLVFKLGKIEWPKASSKTVVQEI